MLTDDEKRELIAEARDTGTFETGEGTDIDAAYYWCELARSLADALEGTLTEPEWEYGYTDHSMNPTRGCQDFQTARACARGMREKVVRRRKAGPWIEVPDV